MAASGERNAVARRPGSKGGRRRANASARAAKVVSLYDADVGEAAMRTPPPNRGRVLYTEDVQELLGRRPDGSFRKSAWWVTHHVAPDRKMRLGRDACWYEADVHAWLDAQSAAGGEDGAL